MIENFPGVDRAAEGVCVSRARACLQLAGGAGKQGAAHGVPTQVSGPAGPLQTSSSRARRGEEELPHQEEKFLPLLSLALSLQRPLATKSKSVPAGKGFTCCSYRIIKPG